MFSFVQEYRAERAVAALGRILPHQVRVRRDGRQTELRAEDIVPGDLVVLSAGDRVPADAQLVWDARLKVDMSTLTGESKPVWRRTGSDDGGEGIEAVDRVFAGTYVASGAAEAVVATTGMRTELGRITSLTAGAERHDSPLELEMRRVTRVVALLSVSLGAAFFLLAGSLGMGATERFLFAIGVIVANVPEGLLPTVTLSLALATQRMARRNAIVRRLSAVETLGETTVICTDKTGTLTENQMTVTRVWLPSGELDVDGTGYSPAGARGSGRGHPTRQRSRSSRAPEPCATTPASNATATSGASWVIRRKAPCSPWRARWGSTSTRRPAATRASTSSRSIPSASA